MYMQLTFDLWPVGGGSCDPGDSKDVEVRAVAYVGRSQVPVLLERFSYSSYRVRKVDMGFFEFKVGLYG